MLDFLDELIQQGHYQDCLRKAEQLLLASPSTLEELAELNLVVSRCRMWMKDYFGAVPPAQLAFKIARDRSLIPLLIKAFDVLGGAYYYTRQYDPAIALAFSYYELIPLVLQHPAAEGKVCNLLGLAQYYKQQYNDSFKAWARAAACFRQTHDTESVLRSLIWGVRCAQMVRDLPRARSSLGEAMRQARALPGGNWVHQEILVLRSEIAFREGRPERGAHLAVRALALEVTGSKLAKFRALMILHQYSLSMGELKDALGYALAARVTALEAGLFHLEYEAAEAMMETIKAATADDVSQLDQEYLSTGVDISRYVPGSVLRHRA